MKTHGDHPREKTTMDPMPTGDGAETAPKPTTEAPVKEAPASACKNLLVNSIFPKYTPISFEFSYRSVFGELKAVF